MTTTLENVRLKPIDKAASNSDARATPPKPTVNRNNKPKVFAGDVAALIDD